MAETKPIELCIDCQKDITEIPHYFTKEGNPICLDDVRNRRNYKMDYSVYCNSCGQWLGYTSWQGKDWKELGLIMNIQTSNDKHIGEPIICQICFAKIPDIKGMATKKLEQILEKFTMEKNWLSD